MSAKQMWGFLFVFFWGEGGAMVNQFFFFPKTAVEIVVMFGEAFKEEV